MDWREKVEKGISRGLDSSKSWFGKASERARELGEQGVLALEIRQLESKIKENTKKLGERVYTVLIEEKQSTVSARTQGVKELLEEIESDREMLAEKQAALRTEEAKEANASQNSEASSTADSAQGPVSTQQSEESKKSP